MWLCDVVSEKGYLRSATGNGLRGSPEPHDVPYLRVSGWDVGCGALLLVRVLKCPTSAKFPMGVRISGPTFKLMVFL